jgi:hypothetical protein
MSRIYEVGEVRTIAQLDELEHFADGEYKSYGLIPAESIDSEIAEGPCEKCGKKREYRAVYDSDSYRAFSVCRTCDHVIEF